MDLPVSGFGLVAGKDVELFIINLFITQLLQISDDFVFNFVSTRCLFCFILLIS